MIRPSRVSRCVPHGVCGCVALRVWLRARRALCAHRISARKVVEAVRVAERVLCCLQAWVTRAAAAAPAAKTTYIFGGQVTFTLTPGLAKPNSYGFASTGKSHPRTHKPASRRPRQPAGRGDSPAGGRGGRTNGTCEYS